MANGDTGMTRRKIVTVFSNLFDGQPQMVTQSAMLGRGRALTHADRVCRSALALVCIRTGRVIRERRP